MKAADVYVTAIAAMTKSPETKIRAIIKQLVTDDLELREYLQEEVSDDEADTMLQALKSDKERVLAGFISGFIQPIRRGAS